jgi:hypothetical protein
MVRTLRPCVIVSMALFLITSLHAQTPPDRSAANLIRVTELEAEEIRSPQYDHSIRGTSTSRDGSLEWLQVRAEYATALEWTDQITFTFYVALRGEAENLPEGATPTNVFSGTVTLINVPQDKDHVVDMFLDPYTFARYGEVFAVAVQVEVNGQPAALSTEPESLASRRWWESESPNVIPLMNRYESPFRLIEIDKQGILQP